MRRYIRKWDTWVCVEEVIFVGSGRGVVVRSKKFII